MTDVDMENSKQEQTPREMVSIPARHYQCWTIAIALILIINVVLTIFGVVIGIQMMGQMSQMEEQLAPLMEAAETVDSATSSLPGAGGGGSGPGN